MIVVMIWDSTWAACVSRSAFTSRRILSSWRAMMNLPVMISIKMAPLHISAVRAQGGRPIQNAIT